MLKPHMPFFEDQEGLHVPADIPPVIDAHVHIFPSAISSAVWKWFDDNAWKIRYKITSSRVIEFLLSHGVKHIVALQYAHKPGIARLLNRYMAEKCEEFKTCVTGMATVFPGEENAVEILQEAFDFGLKGLKLHAHVQCYDMNSDQAYCIYDCCRVNKKPVVMHVGREPKSSEYKCDPYRICSAEKLERIVKDFPDLKICVPHLGFDETREYREMIEKYDNLWLDTTMVITDYFPMKESIELLNYRSDRVMYGSDFPNIPYSWDRELLVLKSLNMQNDILEKVTCNNAVDFFDLE